MNGYRLAVLALVLLLGPSAGEAADDAASDPLMTVSISGETLGEMLQLLGSQSGYNIAVATEWLDARAPRRLTLDVRF